MPIGPNIFQCPECGAMISARVERLPLSDPHEYKIIAACPDFQWEKTFPNDDTWLGLYGHMDMVKEEFGKAVMARDK